MARYPTIKSDDHGNNIDQVAEATMVEWEKKLSSVGVEAVRNAINRGKVLDLPPVHCQGHASSITKSFAEWWLDEQDRKADRRSRWQHGLLWAAVVFAALAVIVPVVIYLVDT